MVSCLACFSSSNSSDPGDTYKETEHVRFKSVGIETEAPIMCQNETQTDLDELRVVSNSSVGLASDLPHSCSHDTPKEESSTLHGPTCSQAAVPEVSALTSPAQFESLATVRAYKEDSSIPFPPQFYTAEGHLTSPQTASGSIRNSRRKDDVSTMEISKPLLGHQNTAAADQFQRREQLEFHDSEELELALHGVFLQFARFGNRSDSQQLDSFRFMKLCRECCLTTDLRDTKCVDLIFYQGQAGKSGTLCAVFEECHSHPLGSQSQLVREEKERKGGSLKLYSKTIEVNNKHKMNFSRFKLALDSIAELLGLDVVDVHRAIASSSGPLLHNVTLPAYSGHQHVSESQKLDVCEGDGEERTPDLHGGFSSDQQNVPDAEFETARCCPANPAFKVVSPGTYPTAIASASISSSSGFEPVIKPRVGSPRGGC